MFKSKKAFAKALIKGRKFKTNNGGTCCFDASRRNPFTYQKSTGSIISMLGVWDVYGNVTEILPEKEKCCCCCKEKCCG